MTAIAAPDRADPFSTAERGFGPSSQEVQAEPRQRPLRKLRQKTILALGLGDPDAGVDKAPLPARRRYLRSREGHTVQLVEADILNTTRDHKHFKIWTTTLTEQPRFDDATAFGVTDAHIERLTGLEIGRLSKLAAADTPGLFSSQGILGKTDNRGYEDLSGLADQLICNFQIIKHDNCCLCIEKGAPNKLPCHDRLADARRSLMRRYHNPSGQVEPRPPRVLSDARKNKDAYFLLVDWVLGSTAWWLLRTAVSTHWQNQILAVLAQWSVKLKLISFDPERYAMQSLADSEEVLRAARLSGPYNDGLGMVAKVRGPKRNLEETAITEESDMVGAYYVFKLILRERLEGILRNVFMMLQGKEIKESDAGTFEAIKQRDLPNGNGDDVNDGDDDDECAEVVWDKENDSQELALRRIDDLVSILVPLAFTSPFGCALVEELIVSASYTTSDTDPIYQFKPPPSKFEFGFAVFTSAWRRRRARLDSGDDHDPEVVSLPNFPFRRPFRAGTNLANHKLTQRAKQQQRRLSVISKTHSTTPSQGILSGVQRRPRGASPGAAGPSKLEGVSQIPKATQEQSQRVLEEYRLHSKLVKSWVVGEASITVSCKLSSRLAIASAATLVVGGLVIAFTVGSRIEQVDPFNVASYMWFVAGFVLLVFKSRFVSDWPWHDFLRGHVVCRSVRDLAEVTGASQQMVLLYLIHNEHRHILCAGGPYNGMFTRRPVNGTEGFIIDVPTHLSTMVASGLLVFKVLNESGEHLVCLDTREGRQIIQPGDETETTSSMNIGREDVLWDEADSKAVTQQSDGETVQRTADKTEGTSSGSRAGVATDAVYRPTTRADRGPIFLTKNSFTWRRMLGLYVENVTFG